MDKLLAKGKESWRALQIAFAYIGTVVGAGFATGQEILQFFTQFGRVATLTVIVAAFMFVVCGHRLMRLARTIRARSYEDLNVHLFGTRLGRAMSLFTLVVLLAVTGVMLAGAGSIFEEHLHWPYQLGLLLTLALTLAVLRRGMTAILSVNTIVVPMLLLFSLLMIQATVEAPLTARWLTIHSDHSLGVAWLAPFLYVSFNLWMAQAVLVPLGASTASSRTLFWGNVIGGAGIGGLIWIAHFSMAPLMPGIQQYAIPTGQVILQYGPLVHILFLCILFSEIFTTLIANVYGLGLQLQNRFQRRSRWIPPIICVFCFAIAQFGFRELLSFLYPLFGLLSLVWFAQLLRKRLP